MDNIKKNIEKEIKSINNINELKDIKVKYMGKKGIITELNSKIKDIPKEDLDITEKTFAKIKTNIENILKNTNKKIW